MSLACSDTEAGDDLLPQGREKGVKGGGGGGEEGGRKEKEGNNNCEFCSGLFKRN